MRQFQALVEHRAAEERAQDRRAALIAAVIANANRDPRKRARPYRIEDFMPGERGRQSPVAQAAMLGTLAASFARGVDKRG